MSDDLKDYRADSFILFDGDTVVVLLCCLVAVAFIADKLGWL